MDKQFYDKYSKEFHCSTCQELTTCVNRPEPLFPNCCEQYLRDRIAELEEQLKTATQKFKVGQDLYVIDEFDYSIVPFEIDKILITENGVEIKSVEWKEWFTEDEFFVTREEAQAKLEELKGENV